MQIKLWRRRINVKEKAFKLKGKEEEDEEERVKGMLIQSRQTMMNVAQVITKQMPRVGNL